MPRYTEEQRQNLLAETRQALLDSAAEEFAREGYNGANINRISTEAGFAKGTIYNYFSSKRELMENLIQDTAVLHQEIIQSQVLAVSSPEERLAVFFEAGFEFVELYHARGKAIVNNLFGPDLGFKEVMFQSYHTMFKLLADEILQPGLEKGSFRSVDPEETANLVMLIYLGVVSQTGPSGKPWVKPAQVADHLLRSLAAGTGQI